MRRLIVAALATLGLTAVAPSALAAEAEVGATGTPFKGTNRDGTVNGWVDAHVHVTADLRAGGRVISGEAFDKRGIEAALGDDAAAHGADGSADITGNLLRDGNPTGQHDVHGWPSFAGWPTHDTNTHQQAYWVWLKRAWMSGMRLLVAQTVEDQPICEIEPVKSHPCDETTSVELQIARLKAMQAYIDSQSGGRGRGFFRLVYGPGQARRAIEQGKLAVIIGMESSDPLGCGLKPGRAQCTPRQIDTRLAHLRRLGVRGMFIAHWVDNALAGAAFEGGAKGAFINVFNRFQTGRWFTAGPCPASSQGEQLRTLIGLELNVLSGYFPATKPLAEEGMPPYPTSRRCNPHGLTSLGRHLVRRLMREHMLIEVDHLSEKARDQVLALARQSRYPLISSHNGTGGAWTPAELRKLYALGGFAAATPDVATALGPKIKALRRSRSSHAYFGVGLGSDTGGFASLPGPARDAAANPLPYPFRSFDGKVTFTREKTGERTFDLNTDGVAQYGLFADLLGDLQRRPGGRAAESLLFRSAEAYLQSWERTGVA